MQQAYEQTYHRFESGHWWFLGRRHILRALVAQEGVDRQSRILEIGCSAGLLMKELQADGFGQVKGIDISPDAIALCRSAGLDAFLMDAQKVELPGETFDIIIASDVLEHLADEDEAVQYWKRLLKPGGLLVIFVPAFMLLWGHHDEANKHHRRYRRQQLVKLLVSSGFKIERSSYWNSLLFGPVAAIRLLRRAWPDQAAPNGQGDLSEPPAVVNRLLASLLKLENLVLRLGINWPFGASVLALARKPAE